MGGNAFGKRTCGQAVLTVRTLIKSERFERALCGEKTTRRCRLST